MHIVADWADYTTLDVMKGNARAILPEEITPRSALYHYVSSDRPRDHDTALEQRVLRPQEDKLDIDISFQKLRYDRHGSWWGRGTAADEHHFVLSLGPMTWDEKKRTSNLLFSDPAAYERLQQRGVRDHNDANAYFSNPLTVHTILIDDAGGIPLFKRSKASSVLADKYHGIAGHVELHSGALFDGTNVSERLLIALDQTARTEVHEELGKHVSSTRLLGFMDCGTAFEAVYACRVKGTLENALAEADCVDVHDHVAMHYSPTPAKLVEAITTLDCTPHCRFVAQLYLCHADKAAYDLLRSTAHTSSSSHMAPQ